MAIKTERTQIHCLSDVPVAVASFGSFKSLLFLHHERNELQCNTSRNRGIN